MQYVLDIPNEKIAEKLLPMIGGFKKDGVKIMPRDKILKEPNPPKYTDEYVQEHWREFVMSSGNNIDYYKSDQYKQERGEYLAEKYK